MENDEAFAAKYSKYKGFYEVVPEDVNRKHSLMHVRVNAASRASRQKPVDRGT